MYVPALLALRVRLDEPTGIAAHFQAKGRKEMLEFTRAQLTPTWSEEAIAQRCAPSNEQPSASRRLFIDEAHACLEAKGCSKFTRCNLAYKEQRWDEPGPATGTSLSHR